MGAAAHRTFASEYIACVDSYDRRLVDLRNAGADSRKLRSARSTLVVCAAHDVGRQTPLLLHCARHGPLLMYAWLASHSGSDPVGCSNLGCTESLFSHDACIHLACMHAVPTTATRRTLRTMGLFFMALEVPL